MNPSQFSDVSQSQKDIKQAIENGISTEIVHSTKERDANPSASGSVASDAIALCTNDTTFAIPNFLPLGGLTWPEPLLAVWRQMEYTSFVGIFAELSRVWFTVDNKLVLWDYRDGREFCCYDEIPDLITAVGNPVKPKGGVFEGHISYLLPIATSTSITLVGIWVRDTDYMSDLKITTLDYTVVADVRIKKICGITQQGRIFCAAADGDVYEVVYASENTPLTPKIRLVCYSYYFSRYPVVGQAAAIVNTLRARWMEQKYPLKDIAIDEKRDVLFSLDDMSTITAWRVVSDGIKKSTALPHKSSYAQGDYRDGSSAAALQQLFIIDPDADGCTLLAVGNTGDQFRYRYSTPMLGDQHVQIQFCTHIPSKLGADRDVGCCFAGGSTVLFACYDRNSETSSDEIVVATAPKTVLTPHDTAREVVVHFGASSANIVRVDAIEKVPELHMESPNDLCNQVFTSPSRFIVAHRHGISLYMQLRAVDTLYMILSSADPSCRDSLLDRFAAVCHPSDYCAMLLQIAIGALHMSATQYEGDKAFSSTAAPSTERKAVRSLEALGKVILSGNSADAQRIAAERLRSAEIPTTQAVSTSSGTRQITITMSPFSSGLLNYISRVLYLVWELPLVRLQEYNLAAVEANLSRLCEFLESRDVDTYKNSNLQVNMAQQWFRDKVVVTLAGNNQMSVQDLNRLQSAFLYQCFLVASKSLQTALFLRAFKGMPLDKEDRNTTFSQIVREEEIARRLGTRMNAIFSASNEGVSSFNNDQSRRLFSLHKACPHFFTHQSVHEYKDVTEMELLTQRSAVGFLSEAEMAQWEARVTPRALSYWESGTLQQLCSNLNGSKREDVSVRLLLHAAQQLDPSNTIALPIFLAERNGQSCEATTHPSSYAIYQKKRQILAFVTKIISDAWLSHRSVVDSLLGGPSVSGTIWQVEPSDQMSHFYLFDWLNEPRADEKIGETLKETLVNAKSQFLKDYLMQNATAMGGEYARYLRSRQGDFKKAIEQSLYVADAPMNSVALSDRLRRRVAALREAYEWANECGSDQAEEVRMRLRNVEAQQRLVEIIGVFLASGSSDLETTISLDGRMQTGREAAQSHLNLVSDRAVDPLVILNIAGMYAVFGGAEVQLDVLMNNHYRDIPVFVDCIRTCYANKTETYETVTRRLIERHLQQSASFPLCAVVRMLELRLCEALPTGGSDAVRLLLVCGVDPVVLFRTYQSIIENNDDTAAILSSPPTGYLAYSLAVVLEAVCANNDRTYDLNNFVETVRNFARLAALQPISPSDLEAAHRAQDCVNDITTRVLF